MVIEMMIALVFVVGSDTLLSLDSAPTGCVSPEPVCVFDGSEIVCHPIDLEDGQVFCE